MTERVLMRVERRNDVQSFSLCLPLLTHSTNFFCLRETLFQEEGNSVYVCTFVHPSPPPPYNSFV